MAILTEEQTKEIVDSAIEQIKKEVIAKATAAAVYKIGEVVATVVGQVIEEHIREQVAPEIIGSLDEQKSFIIEAAVVSAQDMAVALAESMAKSLAENLASGYKRDDILKAMFGL